MSLSCSQLLHSVDLHYPTYQFLKKTHSPICGLMQALGFIRRNKFGPRVYAAAADLSGVHHLLGLPDPGRGAYHTGGTGIYLNEPVIKSVGETIERYAQMVSEVYGSGMTLFHSYDQMLQAELKVIDPRYLSPYQSMQFHQPHFPFQAFDAALPLTWMHVNEVFNKGALWVPAQLVLVGYQIKRHQGEPWYGTAVTTGTAAHTDRRSADFNAIFELIQIDSAMGAWYTQSESPRIVLDHRTEILTRLLQRYHPTPMHTIQFYWLKNPDLPGFSIACVLEKPKGACPRWSVGLGADGGLVDAMYKACLEAVGVSHLSYTLILKNQLQQTAAIDPAQIYNIDANVAWYGMGEGEARFRQQFNPAIRCNASDLPPDMSSHLDEQWDQLMHAFSTDKTLYHLDLTHADIAELGFVVSRWWSPELLSLCFPSAPQAAHPRFESYGGLSHVDPHPYP